MKQLSSVLLSLLAAVSFAQKAPVLEARDLSLQGTTIGRGVVAYGVRDDGIRWYYSRSTTNGAQGTAAATTTIQSWSGATGAPIRAIYRVSAGSTQSLMTVEVHGSDALIETTDAFGETRRAVLHGIPGTVLQMSQFNPLEVAGAVTQPAVDLTIIDPIAMRAVRANVRRVVTLHHTEDGKFAGDEYRFLLRTAGSSESFIRVDQDGRLIDMTNDRGFLMRPDRLNDSETRELADAASQMQAG